MSSPEFQPVTPSTRPGIPWIAAVLAALLSGSAAAHHSESGYDRATKVTIEGTIVRYDWRNPHVYLWVEQRNGDETLTWEVEGQPPAILKRHGWTQEQLAVGERIVVSGRPGRNANSHRLLLDTLTKANNGTLSMATLFSGTAQADAAAGAMADSLAGTWATVIDYALLARLIQASSLPLSPAGKSALEAFNEQTDSPGLECIPYPAPTLMLAPDIKQIEIADDRVIIRGEFEATERTVHLSLASHDDAPESVLGHSIGHWEGSTFVIDTARFTPHRQGVTNGVPSGPNKHLVERLQLSEDGTYLNYSFELRDPDYLAQPISGEGIRWSYRPDLNYEALPCDVETARRFAE